MALMHLYVFLHQRHCSQRVSLEPAKILPKFSFSDNADATAEVRYSQLCQPMPCRRMKWLTEMLCSSHPYDPPSYPSHPFLDGSTHLYKSICPSALQCICNILRLSLLIIFARRSTVNLWQTQMTYGLTSPLINLLGRICKESIAILQQMMGLLQLGKIYAVSETKIGRK